MTEASILAEEENNRILDLLNESGMKEAKIEALRPVIENVAWMKVKLDDTREKIKTSSVVVPYDNGGGQTGIRENPLYKGYESLWKSYMTGMSKILEAFPAEEVKKEVEAQKPATVLEMVRGRHRA